MSNSLRYIPTLSVLTSGELIKLVDSGRIKGEILIPWGLISFLERLAERGDVIGIKGLNELKKLREKASIKFIEDRSREEDLTKDHLESLIRRLAFKERAIIVTDKEIHVRIAEAMGLKTFFIKTDEDKRLLLEKFFDEHTMSIHLKENVVPHAKKGHPGRWKFVPIRDKPIERREIDEIIEDIKRRAEKGESFIEIDKGSILIIQLRDYRIVITRPPLSDGLELTAVRPVAKLSIEDYNLPYELIERFERKAEGILIAGAPGEGKTTFAQALAEFYKSKGKVVKTIEAPRDLQLPEDITQYSKAIASSREIHDVLLLSRPDYTIFDEMRSTEDFELFMDLRLAGVGMVGVIHATSPIDAIQRFVERVDLGMIPSILDTVIFIEGGKVRKVYEVTLVAKVPHGLKREDLARPIVEVRDFFTKQKEYEMYVFGKRVFVIPMKKEEEPSKFQDFIGETIRNSLSDYVEWVKVRFTSDREAIVYVPDVNFDLIEKKIRRRLKKIERKYKVYLVLQPFINYNEYAAFKFTE